MVKYGHGVFNPGYEMTVIVLPTVPALFRIRFRHIGTNTGYLL
ncbi:hypothetical protein SVI_2459 [Shewanella violacea DSS12]|uniref:Uncharacterized protein n=1 Tax=Shewanella violacea (strain JCM 10179 / CIP 106290 / LMG 19151 / DSS12) TaxID=637905 RepID=D4ZL81_SHEVD|nr:hypothetical protein SVI_2459 [Shewanella violacea DSS12]